MRHSLIPLNNKSQLSLNPLCFMPLYHRGMSIGGRFRRLRQHLDLSGDQIGEICGVSKSMVSQWESDSTTPPTERLVALAEKYDFSMDWLLRNKGPMFAVGMYVTDRKIMAAVTAMEPLPAYGKDQVVKSVVEVAQLIAAATAAKPNGTDG